MMRKLFLWITLLIFACLLISGCTGPSARGWSGFAGNNKLIYVGAMDGEILAIDPIARGKGLGFPSQGEWEYVIKLPATSSMCGIPSCAPGGGAVGVVLYASPVISDDLLYMGTYNGKIYAFNSLTGALRWVYPREGNDTAGSIVGNLVVDSTSLYFGSSNGKVYALDKATGDRKWPEYETQNRIWTSPSVSDGVIYVSSYDKKLHAISSIDGKKVWQTALPSAICSSPVVSKDTIFCGTFDRNLYALNKTDAKVLWKFEGGNWFWADPLIQGNIVYAACLDSRIYAIDATTGKEIWHFECDKPLVAKPALASDKLAVVSESGSMYLLDAATGELKKTVSVGAGVMSPLFVTGNTIYIHSRDDYTYAFDLQSGDLAWKFKKVTKKE
jgi:eukaryotic-like serine/threonine-protein kinase